MSNEVPVKGNFVQAVATGLTCVVMPARFYDIAASPEVFAHVYAEDGELFDRAEILLAATEVGLKAKYVRSSLARLSLESL